MSAGNAAAAVLLLSTKATLVAIAVAMVHRTRKHALLVLLVLFALAMLAMTAASAVVTLTLVSTATTLATVSVRTSGRTPASAAPSAFAASGTSGGVIRSYIHVTLLIRFYPLAGDLFRYSKFALPYGSQLIHAVPAVWKGGQRLDLMIYSRPSSA